MYAAKQRSKCCLQGGLSSEDKRQGLHLDKVKLQGKGAEAGVQQREGEAGRGWWHRMDREGRQVRSMQRLGPDIESEVEHLGGAGSSRTCACLDRVGWFTFVSSPSLHPGIQAGFRHYYQYLSGAWRGCRLDLR